ncbi:hypothetical protein ACXZ66_04025 [Corynebacterium sp. S7]
MSSWFDQFEKSPLPDDSDNDVEMPETRSARYRGGMGVRNPMLWLLVALAVVVLVLAGSFVWLFSGSSTSTAAEEGTAEPTPPSEVVEATPTNPDLQVAVAGQCEPEEGETTLSTGDDSLRATVANWQDAYYSQDTGLTKYLTEDSWMHEQDWEEILPEAAPDGVSWCAVMAPVEEADSGASVDVDLMVTFADDSSQTYQQTVIGDQDNEGAWFIADIVTR